MSRTRPSVIDRFRGSLLGLAVGDALGAFFEGASPTEIRRRYSTAAALISDPPAAEMRYTDDTQMAIGVAETLLARGTIDEAKLCERFAANYEPHRRYGRGARVLLSAMRRGDDHRHLAAHHFPGGSLGNGAAMRVAPVGLVYRHDHDRLWEQARRSALPTHVHPLGIEGAQVLALAVGLAAKSDTLERRPFVEAIATRCRHAEYRQPLQRVSEISDAADLKQFGNGITATTSVMTAIACFATGNRVVALASIDFIVAFTTVDRVGNISTTPYLVVCGFSIGIFALNADRERGIRKSGRFHSSKI